MSLVGIDVGSSAVKVAAYSDAGDLLGLASNPLAGRHPAPGLWEQDAEPVWLATRRGMRELTRTDAVRRDPPRAIAVSASGRENFLADADGLPLAPAVMGADTRGADLETPPAGPAPEPWCLACGHLRERMDPVLRLQWWRREHPDLVARAASFPGWHEFLVRRMTGRAVADPATASRYLTYDLELAAWSPGRAEENDLSDGLLPEVLPWPSVIDELDGAVAADWGLPARLPVCLGGLDVSCAALGAGVAGPGSACLVSGSYENVLAMTGRSPTSGMLQRGLSVMPHPGDPGRSVLAVSPTGNAVLDWARHLVGSTPEAIESELSDGALGPGPLQAVPFLSGSMVYWQQGRRATGALIGLSLATGRTDVVRAFQEAIAYDHVITLGLLREEGVVVDRLRATGGGARSRWWTQLKADLTGCPVEVVAQPETGTLGAALLAGQAIGALQRLDEVSQRFAGTAAVHQPDAARAGLHQERLGRYRELVETLLREVF